MFLTLQDQFTDAAERKTQNKDRAQENASTSLNGTLPRPKCGMPTRIERLFGTEPIDLAGVCDEIRRTPGLEAIALRLISSLSLSIEESASTVEEAAIALGTSRLMALFQGWAMLERNEIPNGILHDEPGGSPNLTPEIDSRRGGADWTPESLYLAGFLRILGLDSLPPHTSEANPELPAECHRAVSGSGVADTFLQDFITLIPSLGACSVAPIAAKRTAGASGNS